MYSLRRCLITYHMESLKQYLVNEKTLRLFQFIPNHEFGISIALDALYIYLLSLFRATCIYIASLFCLFCLFLLLIGIWSVLDGTWFFSTACVFSILTCSATGASHDTASFFRSISTTGNVARLKKVSMTAVLFRGMQLIPFYNEYCLKHFMFYNCS